MPWLEITRKGRAFGTVEIGGTEALVGRGVKAQVQLEDERISRRHARLFVTHEGWHVEDLHTANGTWVNGVREFHQRLVDGDRLQLGDYQLVFRRDEDEPLPAPPQRFEKGNHAHKLEAEFFEEIDPELTDPGTPLATVERALSRRRDEGSTRIADLKELATERRMQRALDGPHLMFRLAGEKQPRIYPLVKAENVVGSAPDATVRIPELRRRRAAVILRDADGEFRIRAGLLAALTVNGKRVRSSPLKNGDIVHLGPVPMMFRAGLK